MRIIVRDNFTKQAAAALKGRTSMAGHIMAQQIRKDTSVYVPFLTGSLDLRTRVVGNTIIYPGPYARYLYYGVKMVDAQTGKGPMHYVDKEGNEVIRYRKGATLKPTNIPLKYTTQHHPLAGPKWFERSKAQNLEKWKRVLGKAISIRKTP